MAMAMEHARRTVALRPVVEVAPWRLSDLPLPQQAGAREHPREWGEYFRRCLEHAGFPPVAPIRPGSHYVLASEVMASPLLERLVRDALEDVSEDDADETIGPFDSGFVLYVEGEAVLEPGCCSDFGTLASWAELLVRVPGSGTVWTGHPELRVEVGEDWLTVREGWDGAEPPPRDLAVVRVNRAELARAVAHAREELALFRLRVRDTVRRVRGETCDADGVTARLLGDARA